MRNRIAKRYLALIGLLATVALLGATACSSSGNEIRSSSSSESSAAVASEEDPEESPEEPQQETSEQIPDEEAEETSEEAGQARETLINIFIDFTPFENEDFVACLVDTTRENFGGTYARMLDGLFADKETPKLDQASDDALEFCRSELTPDELQLVEEIIEDDENESEAEDSETTGQAPTQAPTEVAPTQTEAPPPPTIGNCNTTIGVDYELFYDFSQAPDVVMVGYGEVLNLYDDPDVSSSVILTIPALEESIGYEGWSRQIASNTWPHAIWHCMTYNGFHGWVPAFYVSMLADSSAAWSGYGLVGLVRSDLEEFEVDVQNIFGGACPEYNGVGTQIILSDLQTRFNGGDVTFDIRGWCDDAASGIRLTLTAEKQLSRQESYEVISAEIRPLCMRGVSGQNCL
ncbi:MAG: hypothetical protein L7S58_03060 [Acidimicrobiales bacterium]|nr:hypothetical protein [Acidimicrobiales bacterium]